RPPGPVAWRQDRGVLTAEHAADAAAARPVPRRYGEAFECGGRAVSDRVVILNLFPAHADLNGDRGNVLALRQRLVWSGIPVEVLDIHAGDGWPQTVPDIVHLGGGTVAAQRAMLPSLVPEASRLADWADA